MKRITLLIAGLLLFTVLSGCTPASTTVTPTPDATPAAEEKPTEAVLSEIEKRYESIIAAYMADITAEIPATSFNEEEGAKLVESMVELYRKKATSKEIFSLYQQGIIKLIPEQADKFTAYAISGMRRNSFQDYNDIEKYSNNREFMDNFFREAEEYGFKFVYLNSNTDKIKDQEIKGLVEKAKDQGYYIASSEGMLYPLVDYTQFAKFRNYNTKAMASLIETLAIDSLDHMTSDAALIVDWEVLAARTYNIEMMLQDYKGILYEKYLAVRFKDHMVMLFYGVNNTPAFDYQTKMITEDSMALFKDVMDSGNSFMAQLVKEYVTILDSNGYILDDTIREKSQEILSKIDAKYSITQKDNENFGKWMSGEAVAE